MDGRVKVPGCTVIQDIQLKGLIHYGAYSKVVEAKWEGLVVAVKQIHDVYKKDFEIAECERIHQLGHTHIVRFFGIYFPSGADLPSLVMERLDCNLYDLLEKNLAIPTETKLSLLHQIGLGLRYLHSRVPPIVHGKLSSKKVLISKGMEAKIAYVGTIVNTGNNSTNVIENFEISFIPPERTTSANSEANRKDKEVDVFSFGCIILHIFSSTKPSHLVISKPTIHSLTTSENVKRNIQHLDNAVEDVIVLQIICCLKHNPSERPSVIEVCDKLETLLIDRRHSPSSQQIIKTSKKFWMKLELAWDQCTSLPVKGWVTSAAVCDGSVYIAATDHSVVRFCKYNLSNNTWSQLPSPPSRGFSLVAVPHMNHLLAIGGLVNNITSNEVLLWDKANQKWIIRYPNMPTPRWRCSSISHESKVIVAGGITGGPSLTLTTAVEVLHISDTNSYCSVAERLPVATYNAFPLIIDKTIYISAGHGKDSKSTCNIVTTFLPYLLQSGNSSLTSGQVWNKLPDMPYSATSICHYQGHLITFGGDHLVEQTSQYGS